MCGIAGFVGRRERQLLKQMSDIMTHRGPDDVGYFHNEDVGLANRRLSIIDLETGHQPIHNEDKSLWVVFNGEIYNYLELRRELSAKGHQFSTASDTEVLLHLYEEHGDLFPQYLNGIFGFAIWDSRQKRLILGRDHLGVKPLYYVLDRGVLYFASEIKALLLNKDFRVEVDEQSLHYLLNLRYVPTENTLFKSVKKLPPGHILSFERGQIATRRYWQLKASPDGQQSEDYFVEKAQQLLRQAVIRQTVSDVPIGVFLSGGMDSSSIVAMMASASSGPIKTFSLGFGQPTDELTDARLVADYFGTEHYETVVNPKPLEMLPRLIWHAEEPRLNLIQVFLISQFASQHVKVVLGGMGGDEVFGGYNHNKFYYYSDPFHKLMPAWLARMVFDPASALLFKLQDGSKTLRFDEYRRGLQLFLSLGNRSRYYLTLRNTWDYDAGNFDNAYSPRLRNRDFVPTSTVFREYFNGNGSSFLDQALLAEIRTKMVDDFLLSEDKMSMANSLEVRTPFLDKELVEFCFTIPAQTKLKGGNLRYVMKEAMAGLLPQHTLQKRKWGFAFDPTSVFEQNLRDVASKILTKKSVEEKGYFNYDYIKRIIDHPPHPRMRWHYFFLWLLVSFDIWHKMFVENSFQDKEFSIEAYYGR